MSVKDDSDDVLTVIKISNDDEVLISDDKTHCFVKWANGKTPTFVDLTKPNQCFVLDNDGMLGDTLYNLPEVKNG